MKSEFIQVGEIGIQFLLQAADTNGAVAMFEFTIPAGARMPLPHKHERYDETIYGGEGVVTFTVEGKPWRLPQGNTRHAVPGCPTQPQPNPGRFRKRPSAYGD